VLRIKPDRVLPRYLLALGALLFVQGTGSVVLRAAGALDLEGTNGIFTADMRHAGIHIAWGLALLAALAARSSTRRLERLAFVFGGFYTALALAGFAFHNPFGLMLGWGENIFHSLVGPATLACAVASARLRRAPTGDEQPVRAGAAT
jgi:hypothetical protein